MLVLSRRVSDARAGDTGVSCRNAWRHTSAAVLRTECSQTWLLMSDWVTFPDGRRGRLGWAWDAERAALWQRMLSSAHGDTRRPICDCVAGGRRLELAVRELIRRDDGRQVRRYCLARMPHDGTLHQAGCPFHETDARRSGRSGYQQGVIRELPDGRLRIAIAGGLEVRQPAPEPVAA